MSRLLFAALPAPEHINPMLTLAEALSNRGYDIIFHTGELFRNRVEAAGLRFVPFPTEADFDHRDSIAVEPSLRGTPCSEMGLAIFARLLGGRIPHLDRSLRGIVATEKVDAILHDVLFMGAFPLLLRDEPRPPIISCGVVTPMWLDPGCSMTSVFSDAPDWRELNISENQKVAERRGTAWRYIDDVLDGLGLAIPGGFHDNQLYRMPDVFLKFGAEAFEFPLEKPQGNVVFVRPLSPKKRENAPALKWLRTRDRDKPLIFVTQGTVANRNLEQLVHPTMKGLASEDVDVLITTGDDASVGSLIPASNAHVVPYVAYEDVLPDTAVFVTNGCYNGVQQALSCGVPIIVAGTSEDKPRVGHRVEWSGVGINLKTVPPTKEQVRDAVKEILGNTSYRERAQALQSTIPKVDPIEIIANQVDAAILSKPHKNLVKCRNHPTPTKQMQ